MLSDVTVHTLTYINTSTAPRRQNKTADPLFFLFSISQTKQWDVRGCESLTAGSNPGQAPDLSQGNRCNRFIYKTERTNCSCVIVGQFSERWVEARIMSVLDDVKIRCRTGACNSSCKEYIFILMRVNSGFSTDFGR